MAEQQLELNLEDEDTIYVQHGGPCGGLLTDEEYQLSERLMYTRMSDNGRNMKPLMPSNGVIYTFNLAYDITMQFMIHYPIELCEMAVKMVSIFAKNGHYHIFKDRRDLSPRDGDQGASRIVHRISHIVMDEGVDHMTKDTAILRLCLVVIYKRGQGDYPNEKYDWSVPTRCDDYSEVLDTIICREHN